MAHCPRCGAPVSGKLCPKCGIPAVNEAASFATPPPSSPLAQGQSLGQVPMPNQTLTPSPSATPFPGDPIRRPGEPATHPAEPVMRPMEPVFRPMEPVARPVEPAPYSAEPITRLPYVPAAAPAPQRPQAVPARKSLPWVKWVGVATGVLALILIILATLGGGSGGGNTVVKTPVITDVIDTKTKAPLHELTQVAGNSRAIYAAVNITVPAASTLSVKWYVNGQHATNLDDTVTLREKYSGWIAFPVQAANGMPQGNYRVEIYLGNEKQSEKSFMVK